jgi:hypothetical protein
MGGHIRVAEPWRSADHVDSGAIGQLCRRDMAQRPSGFARSNQWVRREGFVRRSGVVRARSMFGGGGNRGHSCVRHDPMDSRNSEALRLMRRSAPTVDRPLPSPAVNCSSSTSLSRWLTGAPRRVAARPVAPPQPHRRHYAPVERASDAGGRHRAEPSSYPTCGARDPRVPL